MSLMAKGLFEGRGGMLRWFSALALFVLFVCFACARCLFILLVAYLYFHSGVSLSRRL